jgi:hypothetical protein
MKKKRPRLTADQLAAELERRRALQEPEQEPEDDSVDNFDELPRGLGLYEDEA